jgi:hypothetical protein
MLFLSSYSWDRLPSPDAPDDGQDCDLFHWVVAVLLHYLEHIDTYLRLCVVLHDSCAGRGVHSDQFAIQQLWGTVAVAEQP